MNQLTALDEIKSDLEASISDLKKEQDYWSTIGNGHYYQGKINQLQSALEKALELEGILLSIQRGF